MVTKQTAKEFHSFKIMVFYYLKEGKKGWRIFFIVPPYEKVVCKTKTDHFSDYILEGSRTVIEKVFVGLQEKLANKIIYQTENHLHLLDCDFEDIHGPFRKELEKVSKNIKYLLSTSSGGYSFGPSFEHLHPQKRFKRFVPTPQKPFKWPIANPRKTTPLMKNIQGLPSELREKIWGKPLHRR